MGVGETEGKGCDQSGRSLVIQWNGRHRTGAAHLAVVSHAPHRTDAVADGTGISCGYEGAAPGSVDASVVDASGDGSHGREDGWRRQQRQRGECSVSDLSCRAPHATTAELRSDHIRSDQTAEI